MRSHADYDHIGCRKSSKNVTHDAGIQEDNTRRKVKMLLFIHAFHDLFKIESTIMSGSLKCLQIKWKFVPLTPSDTPNE